MLKIVSIFLAVVFLIAAIPAVAQTVPPVTVRDVPATGYSGTDTIFVGDLWSEYVVDVPKGYELDYSFSVIGNGSIRVLIVREVGTINIIESQVNYYTEFSDFGPVSSYSTTFPADFGFNQDYTILVNSTGGEVTYTASISMQKVEKDSTLYLVLAIIGIAALAVFSWQYVVWQDKQEKKTQQVVKDKRKSKRGKRIR